MPKSKYNLIDAREEFNNWPGSFALPTRQAVQRLAPGTLVKLKVASDEGTDGIWVNVQKVNENRIEGEIIEEPVLSQCHGLTDHDKVIFNKGHIFDMREPRPYRG